jgi:hypothetical protein
LLQNLGHFIISVYHIAANEFGSHPSYKQNYRKYRGFEVFMAGNFYFWLVLPSGWMLAF